MYWNTKYDEWYQVVKNPELMGLRLFVLNIKGRGEVHRRMRLSCTRGTQKVGPAF